MAKKYQKVSSQVSRSLETVVIWDVKGWKENEDFPLLKSHAECSLNVGETPGGPRSQLRFYFCGHESRRCEKSESGYSTIDVETEWLMLCVEETPNHNNKILHYEIKVDVVDEKLKVVHPESSMSVTQTFTGSSMPRYGKLKEEFIKLQEIRDRNPPKIFSRPDNLRIKISVTPIFVSAAVQQVETKVEESDSLFKELKALYAAEENFSDLRLETKDNVTLSAHKFILAARSTVLRKLIGTQLKVEGFNGTIKIAEVNAKPMMVVLHWMYTGELHENAGKCLEEVVDAAIKFELGGLIKLLDRKVIAICTRENMFQLYGTVEKNGMVTAMADIKEFIRENL